MTVDTTAASTVGVDGLGPAGLLARVADADAAERVAARDKLELAVQWCLIHPATSETGAAVWGDAGLPGLTAYDETLGGSGCPLVAAFAPEPFAAALGVSTMAGMQLLADALDLTYRLPRAWAAVRSLSVPPWKARRLAQATHHLSVEAAAHVDRRLEGRLATTGATALDRAVAQATAIYDPVSVAEAEHTGRAGWDVTLTHPPAGAGPGAWAGTSYLQATGDTLDLTRFYDLVCDHAHHLAALGDPDPFGARKAKALGLIADTQTRLDLGHPRDGAEGDPKPVRRPSLTKTRLYLHLTLTDLTSLPDAPVQVGAVERLGPATLDTIRDWLAASHATIVPVLDLSRDDAVDTHDPPPWMRETVILRDPHCVFPWCSRDARACDLDHIDPYVAIDHGGPPGQTHPTALAPLCRRHHRLKTARRWRYTRSPDGTYTWTSPYSHRFLVTGDQTRPLTG